MEYKEFIIPKKSGGHRKITAPDKELLKYQRSQLKQLELLWEDLAGAYNVDDIQHGFLPNRNCVTAAKKHIGFQTTISMDIKDFFDSVTTDHIKVFSDTLANDQYLFHKDGYCSQGFATSPILSNIAIIPALAQLKEMIDELGYNYVLTMYADDITVSVNTEDTEQLKKIIQIITNVLEFYNFQVKPTKTRIRYAKYGFRRILGIMCGEDSIKIPRKTKYKLRAALHQARTSTNTAQKMQAIYSSGGLTTWSKLMLPKAYR